MDTARKSNKSSFVECVQCQVHAKARSEITLELSKAEKAILEARNEKMTVLLEKKDVEEKMKD